MELQGDGDRKENQMNNIQKRFQEIMASAVEETFENMAFLVIEQDNEKDMLIGESEILKASVLIYEPHQGELCLTLSKGLATEIAKTLYLLEDSDIAEQIITDVLKEILNVIAGQMMMRILPEDTTFTLGIPETEIEGIMDPEARTVECRFTADGHLFSIVASGENLLTFGLSG